MNFLRNAIIAVLLSDSIGVEAQKKITIQDVKKQIKIQLKKGNFVDDISDLQDGSINQATEMTQLKKKIRKNDGRLSDIKEESIGYAGNITELQKVIEVLKDVNDDHVNEIAVLKEANDNNVKAMADLLKMIKRLDTTSSPSGLPSSTPFCFDTESLKTTMQEYLLNSGPVEDEYGPIESWNFCDVISTFGLFRDVNGSGGKQFNEDISGWDVSDVSNFNEMFYGAENFNQDIREWDVFSAKSFVDMFHSAEKFNIDISPWDVYQATTFERMFYDAKGFNQVLSWTEIKRHRHNLDEMFTGSSGSIKDGPM